MQINYSAVLTQFSISIMWNVHSADKLLSCTHTIPISIMWNIHSADKLLSCTHTIPISIMWNIHSADKLLSCTHTISISISGTYTVQINDSAVLTQSLSV